MNTSCKTKPEVVERLDAATSQDTFQVALHEQRYQFALNHVQSADRVLEIGTGLGYFSSLLAEKCRDYTGVEYDSNCCQSTHQRLGGKRPIIRADAQYLPFVDASFSSIICLEVLEHLRNFRKAVQEIHRCLTAEGKVVISVPFRKRGGSSSINPYHLYEPGENELTDTVRSLFSNMEVLYQTFDESVLMTIARTLHIRRFLGLAHLYSGLHEGNPASLSRLRISPERSGMKLGLVIVASKPRKVTP